MKGDCNICVNGKLPSDSAICVGCGLSRKNYKPITNYDLLISKTPEEMAKFLTVLSDPKWHIDGNIFDMTVPKESSWLSWLKSPVEVDNGT